jgi:hypothetical protein
MGPHYIGAFPHPLLRDPSAMPLRTLADAHHNGTQVRYRWRRSQRAALDATHMPPSPGQTGHAYDLSLANVSPTADPRCAARTQSAFVFRSLFTFAVSVRVRSDDRLIDADLCYRVALRALADVQDSHASAKTLAFECDTALAYADFLCYFGGNREGADGAYRWAVTKAERATPLQVRGRCIHSRLASCALTERRHACWGAATACAGGAGRV